jgi:hypothetical protein
MNIVFKISCTTYRLLIGIALIVPSFPNSIAQDDGSVRSSDKTVAKPSESELTDGLLELLDVPDGQSQTAVETRGSSSGKKSPLHGPTRRLEGQSRAGGGLGAGSIDDRSTDLRKLEDPSQLRSADFSGNHPLQAVSQGMRTAADLLQSGRSLAQTVELQGDLLRQLDQWISAVQESAASQSNPQTEQERLSEQQSIDNRSADQTTGQVMPDQSSSGQEVSNETQQTGDDQRRQDSSSDSGQSPGQSGTAGPLILDPKDPVSLQQGAWGHLPAQTRSQMQSRMVEQFLPSYRERLEAYYRALLQRESKP